METYFITGNIFVYSVFYLILCSFKVSNTITVRKDHYKQDKPFYVTDISCSIDHYAGHKYLSAKSVLHTGGHMHSLTHSTCHYRSMKREGEQSMLYHWYRVLDFGPDFFWRAVEGLHCLPK